jgi:hypothetical protein
MANSSAVSSGDLATADQFNNLRDDVVSTCSGHTHDGSNGRGDAAFTLAVSGVPLTLENTTDGTSNQVLLLQGDNATRADGDEIYLSFNLDDDGGNSHEFARITGEAVDVSNGSEDGQLRFGVSVAGTMTDVFTINSSIAGATSISYEVDAFTIKGEEGGAGVLYLFADQGDDAGDEWRVNVADGGVMTFANDIASAGSYVTHMTLTPNSTVASSTVAFAGNVTVASDLTVSGGCITLGAATDIDLTDNVASALSFDATGKTGIIDIVTTNCGEGVTMSGTLGVTGVLTATGGIELGHASDTTIARSGSGAITVEGNQVYLAGGTDVPVADGGTGASSLTDGGVLLGSGTSAVTAMAVLADGEMIVGDGTTDPVAESGATLRTSIGVGTGDSPQFTDLTLTGGCITLTGAATDVDLIDDTASALSFDSSGKTGIIDIVTTDCSEGVTMSGTLGVTGVMTATGGIELSHATANTLTASSGVLSIEGNRVFHAGGTDIPVADGGTGASTFTANGILVGNGTSAVAVTATMATKGHVMIGDGSGVPSMLAVGSNNQVLTACSGESTGVKWAAGGSLTEAVETDMEDQGACNPNRYVSPEIAHHHPGVAKAHVQFSQAGAPAHAIAGTSYNVSGVTDGGAVGDSDVAWTVAFANATYTTVGMTNVDLYLMVQDDTIATGGITLRVKDNAGTNTDATEVYLAAFGTQ